MTLPSLTLVEFGWAYNTELIYIYDGHAADLGAVKNTRPNLAQDGHASKAGTGWRIHTPRRLAYNYDSYVKEAG